MNRLFFTKKVDKSLLCAGLTVPVKNCKELSEYLGVDLKRGEKADIKIHIDGIEYHAEYRHTNMQVVDRECFQIRYSEKSAICNRLIELYSSADNAAGINAYIEIWSHAKGAFEFKCFPEKKQQYSISDAFFDYLGTEDSLYGYQKSYKLVFYKCYFQESMYEANIPVEYLTKQFRQFYIDRKRSGQITEFDGADDLVLMPDKGSIEDYRELILRNPFNAIRKKQFFIKGMIDGKEYFSINEELYAELNDEALEKIRSLVYKKLDLYYSKSFSKEVDEKVEVKSKVSKQKNDIESGSKKGKTISNTEKKSQEMKRNRVAPVKDEKTSLGKKAWLLTWNPQNWNWDDYAAGIEASRMDEKYQVTWSCANTHIVPGDSMYLMLLGKTGPRGIIAAGKAISKVFEVRHWDYQKALKGIKTNSVTVSFEKIFDFRTDQVLRIERLQSLFPEQKWNPQGSGIEIRDEYVNELSIQCEKVVEENENGIDTEMLNNLKDMFR